MQLKKCTVQSIISLVEQNAQWDSVLSPPRYCSPWLLPLSLSFDCPAAELLRLSRQSPAAWCGFISMRLTWVTCLCWGGGRGALTLHCGGAFKQFYCLKNYVNVFLSLCGRRNKPITTWLTGFRLELAYGWLDTWTCKRSICLCLSSGTDQSYHYLSLCCITA